MLKLILLGFFLVGHFDSSFSQCNPSPTTASGTHAPSEICSGDLIFEDNFVDFLTKVWDHDLTLSTGSNKEFQWYTNTRYNSWAEEGVLNIRPTIVADEESEDYLTSAHVDIHGITPTDACTNPSYNGCEKTGTKENIINPIKSARIRTVYSFYFKYGKVEIRARLPAGDWLWPAISLSPRWNKYGSGTSSGLIDIVEGRGNRELTTGTTNIGTHQISSCLHWGPNSTWDKYKMTHKVKNNDDGYDSDYHNYQLLWNEDGFTFSVDDEEIGKFEPEGSFWEWGELDESGLVNPWRGSPSKMAPFDQQFFIVINLAVGGGYFSDSYSNPGGKPWKQSDTYPHTNFWHGKNQWLSTWKLDDADTANFKIDYVKVWAI